MIRLFRDMRKKLVTENKVMAYLRYAIGEICLVVIGILIALQVNNWNEGKKLKKEESKLILALKEEIESNIYNLDLTIKSNDTILQESSVFLKRKIKNDSSAFDNRKIIALLGYNTNKFETSILNEILGTNSRALLTNDKILEQLRVLKSAYVRNEKTQFYVDEFWNSQVTSFINSTGLGIYFASTIIDKEIKTDFELNNKFYSLLGMMNGYQKALLMNRQDLEKVLKETLLVLNNL